MFLFSTNKNVKKLPSANHVFIILESSQKTINYKDLNESNFFEITK